jgi:hypothetical protein
MDVDDEDQEHKRIEDLIATGLYKAKTQRIKGYIRELFGEYEQYLKPIEEVRKRVDEEIPYETSMSQVVVELRKKSLIK